jgi:hypothetical protein
LQGSLDKDFLGNITGMIDDYAGGIRVYAHAFDQVERFQK